MNVEDVKPSSRTVFSIKPTTKTDKSSATYQSTTTTYSDTSTTYSSSLQTYGGADRTQRLGPIMFSTKEVAPKNLAIASDSFADIV